MEPYTCIYCKNQTTVTPCGGCGRFNCADVGDYRVPQDKEHEFCMRISNIAWEVVCRGYGNDNSLKAEEILKYIRQLCEERGDVTFDTTPEE